MDKHNTTLIVGKNGAGKSTMLDALTFSLFGKAFRKINKGQLINSVNEKDCLVEIEFTIGRKKYMVRRGMKPNIFEIYCNDSLINQSSTVKDYQKKLEDQILKMSYKTFTQVVILGNSFIPFMQLTPADRRSIIEDLLDIQIFSYMNILLKQRRTKMKEHMKDIEYNKNLIDEKVNIQQKYINNLEQNKEKQIENTKNKIDKADESIEELNKGIEEVNKRIDKLSKKIEQSDKIKKSKISVNHLLKQTKTNIGKAKSQIEFFNENSTCPTCEQTLHEEYRDKLKEENYDLLKDYENNVDKLNEKYDKFNNMIKKIDVIQKKISELQSGVQQDQGSLSALLSQKQELLKTLKKLNSNESKDLAKEKNKLSEIIMERDQIDNLDSEHKANKKVLDVVYLLLKDTGIKTKIISQYLPIINQTINKYLIELGFSVLFELDEGFNEIIRSRFRDEFSYSSFSEGEKQRIDLSLLFTWRDVARMRNSANTNLLILDEVFDSSLDDNGTEDFLKLLAKKNKDVNIFIISHHGDSMYDKFNACIEFKKEGNFSKKSFSGG